MTINPASNCGISLRATHNPLAWLLYFTKLTVVIDGETQTRKWGSIFIPAVPGTHALDISFRYLGRPCGPASATVAVPEGGVTSVTYSMPSWMFANGRLEVN